MEILEVVKGHIGRSEYSEAKKILDSLLAIEPSNAQAILELAKIYQIQGNDAVAENKYNQVLALDPDCYAAKLELARIYFRQRRLDVSLRHYQDYLTRYPDDAGVHKELASLYNLNSLSVESMKSLEKAVSLSPDSADILMELGRSYREQGQKEKAIETFKKIYGHIKPDDKFMSNMVLNEIETTEGKEVLESKVRSMIAMILDKCNIKCRMCKIWSGTWQMRDSIMQEIVDLFPYMENVSWQGGEVFMMKGFEDILQEGTRHKNLKQVIFTNGLMINEKILDKLTKGKVDIVFSIDSPEKEAYEYIRYGAKYERLIKVLELVKEFRKSYEKNVNIYLNAVIMKSNYKQLEQFIEFADKYQFNAVTFSAVKRCDDEDILIDNDKEMRLGLKDNLQKARELALKLGIRLNDWYAYEPVKNKDVDSSGKKESVLSGGSGVSGSTEVKRALCYVPWQKLCLDTDGMVRPFGFCSKIFVGDTDRMSLSEIWNGEAMRTLRRRLMINDNKDICEPECISGQVTDKICRVE